MIRVFSEDIGAVTFNLQVEVGKQRLKAYTDVRSLCFRSTGECYQSSNAVENEEGLALIGLPTAHSLLSRLNFYYKDGLYVDIKSSDKQAVNELLHMLNKQEGSIVMNNKSNLCIHCAEYDTCFGNCKFSEEEKEVFKEKFLNPSSQVVDLKPQKFWTGKYYKTCFNCQHGEKEKGTCGGLYEQPFPDSVTCIHGYDEVCVGHTELELPDFCGHYTPVVINQKCGNKNCKNTVTGNEFEHEHWVTMYDNVPCCSKECVDTVNKELSNFDEEYHNTTAEEY